MLKRVKIIAEIEIEPGLTKEVEVADWVNDPANCRILNLAINKDVERRFDDGAANVVGFYERGVHVTVDYTYPPKAV